MDPPKKPVMKFIKPEKEKVVVKKAYQPERKELLEWMFGKFHNGCCLERSHISEANPYQIPDFDPDKADSEYEQSCIEMIKEYNTKLIHDLPDSEIEFLFKLKEKMSYQKLQYMDEEEMRLSSGPAINS